MFEDLSINEQLDALLTFMISAEDNSGVMKHCQSFPELCDELLVKLEKDGYITRTKKYPDKNDIVAMPTIEGRILILNGGYVAKAVNDKNIVMLTKLEVDRQRTLEINSEKNQIRSKSCPNSYIVTLQRGNLQPTSARTKFLQWQDSRHT